MIPPRTLTRYRAWANRLVFEAVAALPEEEILRPRPGAFRNMVHTLNHIYVIDRIFQAHLEGREHGYSARNTTEHPPLAELGRAQQAIDAWYIERYDAMPPAELNATLEFTFVGGGRDLPVYLRDQPRS
ncbi:MAG: DinB family protein [Burkholderiales bacterium]|nr:DinB family protein [Burkholderiales bacterium]